MTRLVSRLTAACIVLLAVAGCTSDRDACGDCWIGVQHMDRAR